MDVYNQSVNFKPNALPIRCKPLLENLNKSQMLQCMLVKTRIHAYIHIHRNTHMHMYMHACMDTLLTYIHTNTQSHKHVHTQTHIYTYVNLTYTHGSKSLTKQQQNVEIITDMKI